MIYTDRKKNTSFSPIYNNQYFLIIIIIIYFLCYCYNKNKTKT